MNEKIENLLKPRYKVIGDYPNKPITMPIGHILTLDKFGAGKYWHEYTDDEPIHMDEGFSKFPNIFKNLEWWEERTVDEMPAYVKDCDGCVKEVFKHFTYILTDGNMQGEHESKAVCSFEEDSENGFEKLFWRYDCCQPATLQEFSTCITNRVN